MFICGKAALKPAWSHGHRTVCAIKYGQFQVIPLAGGSNSLFLALSYSMFSRFDEESSLRELTVGQILSDPVRYGFTRSAQDRKLIQIMNSTHVFVPFSAFVDASHWDARVYFDSGLYVRVTGKGNTQFVNVQLWRRSL